MNRFVHGLVRLSGPILFFGTMAALVPLGKCAHGAPLPPHPPLHHGYAPGVPHHHPAPKPVAPPPVQNNTNYSSSSSYSSGGSAEATSYGSTVIITPPAPYVCDPGVYDVTGNQRNTRCR